MILVPAKVTVETNSEEQKKTAHFVGVQQLVRRYSIWKCESWEVTVTLVAALAGNTPLERESRNSIGFPERSLYSADKVYTYQPFCMACNTSDIVDR